MNKTGISRQTWIHWVVWVGNGNIYSFFNHKANYTSYVYSISTDSVVICYHSGIGASSSLANTSYIWEQFSPPIAITSSKMYFLETVLFTTVHFNAIREIRMSCDTVNRIFGQSCHYYSHILLSFYFRRVPPQMAKICKLQKPTKRRRTKAHL